MIKMRGLLILLIFFNLGLYAQEPLKIKIAKPECSATLLGKSGGNITKLELQSCNAIGVTGKCDYQVVSFNFTCNLKGTLHEISSKEGYFPSEVKSFIRALEAGNKFFIENIKVKSNATAQTFTLSPLTFKVMP